MACECCCKEKQHLQQPEGMVLRYVSKQSKETDDTHNARIQDISYQANDRKKPSQLGQMECINSDWLISRPSFDPVLLP